MKQFFWLIDGELAGGDQCLLQSPQCERLSELGVKAILSFCGLTAQQCAALSATHIEWHGATLSLAGFPDVAPTDELLNGLTDALKRLHQWRTAGKPALVCCPSGNELTSALLACYLTQTGAAPVHAVSQVRALNADAFSLPGWDQGVFDLIYALPEIALD
ncbi:protein phosphatase [Shewanella sp. GXUN23E]